MPKLSRKEFYDKYYPLAVKYTKGTNINPETMMAQMALESSWGSTANSSNGFAMFGIKGTGRSKTIDLNTTEERKDGTQYKSKENFRAYNSVDESMQDYVKLMQTDRYKNSFKTNDPEQQLISIQNSGYAGKKYADTTTDILKQNKNYIPMGNENKTTAKVGGQDFTPVDNKNSTAKINEQLKMYKEKAKAGTLTDAEYIQAQLLREKADGVLEGHDLNVFNSSFLKDIVKPYTTNEYNSVGAKGQNTINGLKEKLANAQGNDIAYYKNEIAKEQQKLAEGNREANDIFKKIGYIEEQEQAIYKAEQANQKGSRGGIPSKSDESIVADDNQVRLSAIKEYGDLYKNIPGIVENINTIKSKNDPNYIVEIKKSTEGSGLGGALGGGALAGSLKTSTESLQATPLTKTGGDVNIHDITNSGVEGSPFAVNKKSTAPDWMDDEKRLNELKNYKPTEQVYEPDLQSSSDIGGYLMDIGRVGLGIKGAMEKLPDYQPSAMFTEAMQDSQQRQDMGLSADEIGLAKNMAERGFGYDVKNIRNLSGGSAGVALGNLGRANTQLYDAYGSIAAADQQAKRANRQQFYNAADKMEAVNQYGFGIDYNEAMMNKQAGAGLVSDALKNMSDRSQYEKSYGKGSQYYDYLKEQTLGARDERQSLKDANETRRMESIADMEDRIQKKKDAYAGGTNSYTSLDGAKTGVVPKEELPVNIEITPGSGLINTPANKTEEVLAKEGYTGLITEEQGAPVQEVKKDKDGRVISVTTGAGIEGTITSGQKQMTATNVNQGLNPAELKAMEAKGDKIYGLLLDTPEYKQKKNDILAKKLSKEETNKLLNELDKEQQKWADSQFDKDDNYIGK